MPSYCSGTVRLASLNKLVRCDGRFFYCINMNKFFAKKMSMTGKYTTRGYRVGVTALEILPMKVKDLRTKEKHGYEAVRLDTGKKIKEVRTDEKLEIGTEIKIEEILKVGDFVNVAGITKGHGFTGAVKRWGFAGGPRTHGQSDRERAPGSSGSTTTPGRVYKGKHRAGHMGVDRVTVRNLEVLEIGPMSLIIKGSVPGHKTGLLEVTRV